MRTLKLTSPLMKGTDVKTAQKALKKFNVWVGPIDGVFGEMTARACSQAKYMLGYRANNITPHYDEDLDGFLRGTRKPTILMRQRAKSRFTKAKPRDKAADVARSYIGVSENPPKSNRVMFSLWYGLIGAWCAMFVTFVFVTVKSKVFKRGEKYAYVPFILEAAKHPHNNDFALVPKGNEATGDLVLFDWDKDGIPDHIGIIDVAGVNGVFYSIEGNTSGTNPSDGGMVARMERNYDDVIAFVRVLN